MRDNAALQWTAHIKLYQAEISNLMFKVLIMCIKFLFFGQPDDDLL